MKRLLTVSLFLLFHVVALAQPNAGGRSSIAIICSYAPSQSKVAIAIAGAGGLAAITPAVLKASGLKAVEHSSKSLILRGSSGYIAGTLGLPAVTFAALVDAAPIIITVGLVVGGVTVALELVCAAERNPEQVEAIKASAREFSRRMANAADNISKTATAATRKVVPVAGRAAAELTRVAGDAMKYANRASIDAGAYFSRK